MLGGESTDFLLFQALMPVQHGLIASLVSQANNAPRKECMLSFKEELKES